MRIPEPASSGGDWRHAGLSCASTSVKRGVNKSGTKLSDSWLEVPVYPCSQRARKCKRIAQLKWKPGGTGAGSKDHSLTTPSFNACRLLMGIGIELSLSGS